MVEETSKCMDNLRALVLSSERWGKLSTLNTSDFVCGLFHGAASVSSGATYSTGVYSAGGGRRVAGTAAARLGAGAA
jgi:hypothetical protein